MAIAAEPARGMSLADHMGDPPPGAVADGTPETDTPEQATPETPETPETPVVEETPETPETPEAPTGPTSLTGALEDPEIVADRDTKAKAEADKLAADEAAQAEKSKAAAATGLPDAATRDADLALVDDKRLHPKTRQVIKDFRTKSIAARDERDKAKAESLEWEKRALAAEEKAKTVVVPEEMKAELAAYRERVRELDAAHDPEIDKKYNKRIETNSTRALAILEKQGLFTMPAGEGKTRDMTPEEKAVKIAAVKAQGLNVRGLASYIRLIEKSPDDKDAADAEELRELARHNTQLLSERDTEVATIKADYDLRKTTRTTQQKEQADKTAARVQQYGQHFWKADVAELAKQFAWVNPPPAPLPTDIPAVATAKQAAVDAYAAAAKQVEHGIAQFNTQGQTPEKAMEAQGRLNAAAIKSLVLQTHVIPKLAKDLAAATALLKERDAELAKIRDAGRLSRQHSGGSPDPTGYVNGRVPKSLSDALGSGPQ